MICVDNLNMEPELLKTCHRQAVNDVVFPANLGTLFATVGTGDVRIWQTTTGKELRRIEVPNIKCRVGKCRLHF